MGANGSHDGSDADFGFGNCKAHERNRAMIPQGRPPAPEGIPEASEITHNTVTLSWMSPKGQGIGKIIAYQVEVCNMKDRKWKVVTSTCQGTCYRIRNLTPSSKYIFRVRAENICGLSKAGLSSEIIYTRREDEGSSVEEEIPKTKLVRRHSQHLKLDGGITRLLNSTKPAESGNQVGGIPFRRNSVRSSLPPTLRKKNSITSMLPGSKRESVCNMKESKKSVEEQTVSEEEGINMKRISTSSTEGSSIFSANSMNSISEVEEFKMMFNRTDCKDVCSDTDDSFSNTTTSNSNSPHSTNSNPILSAPLTDDTKMAYFCYPDKPYNSKCSEKIYSDQFSEKGCYDTYDGGCWSSKQPVWKDRTPGDTHNNVQMHNNRNVLDLRSLRQMLNSHDIMVKTLDSADSGYYSNYSNSNTMNNKRFHSAIKESDEDEITVDIVSTI